MTKGPGYYAIHNKPVVVDDGLVVSFPDYAQMQEYASLDELKAVYPDPPEEEII